MTEDVVKKLYAKGNVIKNCPFGAKHFCNGNPNPSAYPSDEKTKKREKCEYYRGGMCKNGRVSTSGI